MGPQPSYRPTNGHIEGPLGPQMDQAHQRLSGDGRLWPSRVGGSQR
jgi:hypothetical protein